MNSNVNHLSGDAAILGMGTALPAHVVDQADIAELIAASVQDRPDLARFAKRIFRSCGVETRYTVEPSYLGALENCRYLPSATDEQKDIPTTRERMDTYQLEALPLAVRAAEQAMLDAGASPESISHLITVSCTGQYLPGLDVQLIRQLGLSARVNRLPLIFQGCAAGLKAIQMARDVVQGAPGSQVLVVCVELCSLHFQPVQDREALFAASFFGDAASASIVGTPDARHTDYLSLGIGYSVLLPDSTQDMTWKVADYGYDLHLSPRIPKLLGLHLEEELRLLLQNEQFPELWAIHPGGRGIVDSVQEVMHLRQEQTQYSRDILRDYGNLSSNTILFVLQAMRMDMKIREQSATEGVAMAFGPGLTAELMKFTYVPCLSSVTEETNHVFF
ncbi:type III polyketide synthase [Paenibacillus barcinonensis]|uniref:Putative naringenin-chalcone synthase n=1 Tax=Paenibacillus barcinonensis TaxID=198119 RepID=A0A2V4WQS2_PAEBA|nr:type III polyketide synthase [Paenibacillus barcinonensis]PYE50363.1 putative naringenin-chalcone synthase [Paenibacillus barcinonensis]QKS55037.1 type III polyketide synthase [Paenibacillus barcinonensis]